MLTYSIELASGSGRKRWAVVGRDEAGASQDCRLYSTKRAAQEALRARKEEQAEGVPSE